MSPEASKLVANCVITHFHPADLDTLDAYITYIEADIMRLKEREVMRLASISTAAQGYWKDGDSIHPDYDTVALHDVTALYQKYVALGEQVTMALGFAFTLACTDIDAGRDPRQREVPTVLDEWERKT
jgi:hypothetical protein